jgi:cytochrome c5
MDQNHKKILQLREDYKITFGSDEGKRVYSDLEKRCHENSTTHVPKDSHESAFMEGQRSTLLFIKAMITKIKE